LNSLFRLTTYDNDILIFHFGSIKKIALVTFEFDVHQDDESAVMKVQFLKPQILWSVTTEGEFRTRSSPPTPSYAGK